MLAAEPAPFALCINDIIGEINMLTGYIPIWATCDSDEIGTDAANPDTSLTTPGTVVATPDSNGETAVPSPPVTCEASPAKSTGGKLNGVNEAATELAPA
jgi:hypothetical protein